MAKASWNGTTIAESDDVVIVEGNVYFPRASVSPTFLRDSALHTTCAWKGVASYHDLVVDGKTNKDAVWYYPEPSAQAAEIKNRVAFWKGVTVVR